MVTDTRKHRRKRNNQIRKAQKFLDSGKRPGALEPHNNKNSARLNELQSQWLDRHIELLGMRNRVQKEIILNAQKIQARKLGDLRRLRILENGFSYYSLTQVLTTYGKDCHICHTTIDLKASRRVGVGNWLLGLHIDHLVPIAKGGPDTLENVRPSHAICNLKKGTGDCLARVGSS